MGFRRRFSGKPSRDKFAGLVMDRLQQAGDPRQAVYEKAEFRLLFSQNGAAAGHLNLRNFYDEFLRTPTDKQAGWWSGVVRGMFPSMEIPDEFEDARPDIRPVVRTRSYVESLRLQFEIDGTPFSPIPFVPIGDHLLACLVYDLPNSMVYLTQETLEEWGVTLYEVLEVASQNLAEIPFNGMSIDNRLFAPVGGDSYDASRILLTDKFEQLPITGQLVGMVVNRDRLLLTGDDDDEGLKILADLTEQYAEEPRPLCTIPVRFEDGEWKSWIPPADHPQFARFKVFELKYLLGEHDQQKRQLEQLHEVRGENCFVPEFSATTVDERSFSYAVWSRDVRTLLPKTDEVFFFSPAPEQMFRAPWENVLRTVGHLMTLDDDSYPPRWLVDGFPTDRDFEKMNALPL